MSSKTPDNQSAVVNIAPSEETETEIVESKQPNVAVRAWRKTKANPRTALAVAGGVALVAVSAVIGRKTAPSSPSSDSDPFTEVETDEYDYIVTQVPADDQSA